MTIEKSPPSTEPKPSAASEGKAAKGKPGTAGAQGGAGLGGFMAILAAVDTTPVSAVSPTDDSAAALLSGNAQNSTLPLPSADGLPFGDPPQTQEIPLDGAGLLAQAMQMLSAQPATTSPTDPAQGLESLPPLASALPGSETAPVAALPSAFAPTVAPSRVVSDEPLLPVPRKPAPWTKTAGTDAGSNMQNQGQNGNSAPAAASGANGMFDLKAISAVQKAEAMPNVTTVTPAMLAAAVNTVGRDDEGRERSAFKPHALEASAPQPLAPMSAPVVTGTGPTAVPGPIDVYVAQQVKYWISSDVKNAEMTLDGVGNAPVEVSISMHGNEAHVAFRTDELQARTALENASSHLKDMLQREGLILSGVSVGTAGTQDSGAQERKAPSQGGRRVAGIATTVAAPMQGIARAGTPGAGRALDLFV